MEPSSIFSNGAQAISFVHKLAASDSFKILFRDGMGLVEEAAAYLDGPGRTDSRTLPRVVALAYASESMRLTTRLMQIASWLLLQRAVNEGELTQAQAATEKHKVRLSHQDVASSPDIFQRLPDRLRQLSDRSLRLQARVMHLDQLIYRGSELMAANAPSAIESQLERVRAAFGARWA